MTTKEEQSIIEQTKRDNPTVEFTPEIEEVLKNYAHYLILSYKDIDETFKRVTNSWSFEKAELRKQLNTEYAKFQRDKKRVRKFSHRGKTNK